MTKFKAMGASIYKSEGNARQKIYIETLKVQETNYVCPGT